MDQLHRFPTVDQSVKGGGGGRTRANFFLVGPKDPKISALTNFFWAHFPVAIFKTGNGERGTGNGERGTGNGELENRGMREGGNGEREWGKGNGESLKTGIFKMGNL